MAINKKLINFTSKSGFTSQNNAGNVLDTSICFIDDTNEIYTHKTFFGGVNVQSNKATFSNSDELYKTKEIILTNVSLDPDTWSSSGILINDSNFPNGNGTYLIQIENNSTIYSGVIPIYIATDNSVDTINTDDEIPLNQMGHNSNRLYIKTAVATGKIYAEIYLSSKTAETFDKLTFKFKKLI